MKIGYQISNWLIKISSTSLMIASLGLMIVFMIFVLPAQAEEAARQSEAERSPDTSFYYSPDDLYQMAGEYGESGRQSYIHARWTFDLIFPLVYTTFLAVGISWFFQRLNNWPEIFYLANLLPILGGLFDLLENIAVTLVFSNYPTWLYAGLVSASVFTPIKWVLVSSSFLPYLIFGSVWVVQNLRALLFRKE